MKATAYLESFKYDEVESQVVDMSVSWYLERGLPIGSMASTVVVKEAQAHLTFLFPRGTDIAMWLVKQGTVFSNKLTIEIEEAT